MTRSFNLCVLLSQMALALFLFGERRGEIAFAFGQFFAAHKLLAWYLVGINLAAFAAFAADKYRAVRRRRRIRNATLLTLAALGGSVGGMLAMVLFRHKIRDKRFFLGLPLLLPIQTLLLLALMNL